MKLPDSNGCLHSNNPLSSDWRISFNFAIGLHFLIMAVTLIAPYFFDRKPELPEIYTVNLFTATEVAVEPSAPQAPAQKAPPKAAVKQIEPAKPKISTASKSVAVEKLVAPIEKVDIKPISLRPVKKKIKVGKTKEETIKEKAMLSKAFERIQAKAEEKEAKKEADRTAIEAVSKLADSLRTSKTTTGTSKSKTTAAKATPGVAGRQTTGIEPNLYMKQYYSAVYERIHKNWVLPDLQNWDNSLEAVLVISIKKDGVITNSFFEKKSENIYFNQLVLKAAKDSSPLPPFPDQLNQETMEIGLRFKPGELY
jgi:colicin import membrane protein